MELKITQMVTADFDHMSLMSGSVAELGQDAGRFTWNNSKDYAAEHPLLAEYSANNSVPFQDVLNDARDYFRAFGAWDTEEINGWTPLDVEALVVQEIASQIRHLEKYDDFEAYQAAQEAEKEDGMIYKSGEDYFFTLSH